MDYLPEPFLELGKYNQFILYELAPRKDSTKFDKFPINPLTRRVCNAFDSTAWLSAKDALLFSANMKSTYGHGIGFVFTEKDPFFFLDIDDCLIEGQWSELAVSLCTEFQGAAVEVSSSGRGLHIIGKCEPIEHSCKNAKLGLEFYTKSRFVALTLKNVIGNSSAVCQQAVNVTIQKYFNLTTVKTDKISANSGGPHPNWRGPTDDEELIKIALKSKSNSAIFGTTASFQDLWEANYEVLEKIYHSNESSYDAALAQHLAFWTGNDEERIHRLMLKSKLMREKWDREDYLPRTITNACARQTQFFQEKETQKRQDFDETISSKAVIISGNTFLNPIQQLEHFAGCVYVSDVHKILVPGGRLLKPDQFRAEYGSRTFAMDNANERVTRNAWEAFTESQAIDHPKVSSAYFLPAEAPAAILDFDGMRVVNEYWPVPVKKRLGDVTPFINHIALLYPDDRDQTILTSYFAGLVQYKGVKFKFAPLLQGVEGNGKSLLSDCVARAIGLKYVHSQRAHDIGERFNSWMHKTILVIVEDVYVPDAQREILEILKPMITSDRYQIEPKGKDKMYVPICCNFILNTNHKEGLRKTQNDRRLVPFYAKQQRFEDLARDGLTKDYFADLHLWLETKNGYEFVTQYLHDYKIPEEFNPANKQRAPITSTTSQAIEYGMGTVEQEIMEAVEQNQIGFRDGWISSIFLSQLLDKIQASRRIPRNKRRDLLMSLGYDWHPGLNKGRVNNVISPDNGKPQLFILRDHYSLSITEQIQIARAYSDAQAKEA